jgi:selenocysteine lyase/cysteine desulfurase
MSIILKTGKMVELLVLQVIKTALTIQLKEQMGIDNIMKREHEIVAYIFSELELFRILKF